MKFKSQLESVSASIHAPWFFFDSVSFHWGSRSTALEGRTSSKGAEHKAEQKSSTQSSCSERAAPGCRQASPS